MVNGMGRQRMKRAAIVGLAVILLSGCGGGRQYGGDPSLRLLDSGQLPPPSMTDIRADDRPYLVGPFDRLMIDVFGIEALSDKEVQVDAGGNIAFPLAGTVQIAGKTPGEIGNLLAERLRANHVRDPQVIVNLKEAVSQVVTIEGEVKKPGLYPVVGRMTLLRAMATAEGTTEFSDVENVVVFRTVGQQRYAALYDVGAIRRGAYADPEVYANDVIVVDDSTARRTFKDVLATLPAIATPLIIAVDRLSR